MACGVELGPWRNIVVKAGVRADAAVMAAGGAPLTTEFAVVRMDEALRRMIGEDLAEADPRVRPVVGADRAPR